MHFKDSILIHKGKLKLENVQSMLYNQVCGCKGANFGLQSFLLWIPCFTYCSVTPSGVSMNLLSGG